MPSPGAGGHAWGAPPWQGLCLGKEALPDIPATSWHAAWRSTAAPSPGRPWRTREHGLQRLDGVGEGHCHGSQRDVGQRVAQGVHHGQRGQRGGLRTAGRAGDAHGRLPSERVALRRTQRHVVVPPRGRSRNLLLLCGCSRGRRRAVRGGAGGHPRSPPGCPRASCAGRAATWWRPAASQWQTAAP